MPKPRKSLISLEATAYYHCVSRCVRRAFLCGEDDQTGRSFEHRRGWIEDRLLELGQVFAIEICGFAVMQNHSHGVLHIDQELAESWSMREVIERWHHLFVGTALSQRYLRGDDLLEVEYQRLGEDVETWRERLMSVSWFMRCLNERIARLANEEDECTGHFWEGRFKSQALLDDQAVIACMAYVDLNPVRAGIAKTPEDSDHTSIQRRIRALQAAAEPEAPGAQETSEPEPPIQPPELLPFVGGERQDGPKGLPFHLPDYLELVNWTGQAIREDKRGAISQDLPPILERLGIDEQAWLRLATQFESRFSTWVGQAEHVQDACQRLGHRQARGISACRLLFPS